MRCGAGALCVFVCQLLALIGPFLPHRPGRRPLPARLWPYCGALCGELVARCPALDSGPRSITDSSGGGGGGVARPLPPQNAFIHLTGTIAQR